MATPRTVTHAAAVGVALLLAAGLAGCGKDSDAERVGAPTKAGPTTTDPTSTDPTTKPATAADAAEFCAIREAFETFGEASGKVAADDYAGRVAALRPFAVAIREAEPPTEIATDWKAFVDNVDEGVDLMAKVAADPDDTAARAAYDAFADGDNEADQVGDRVFAYLDATCG